MRILTLTSWYPPHHFGGYEILCSDVMHRLVARGHDVQVLCGDERVPGAVPNDEEHERRVHRELRLYLHDGAPDPTFRRPLRDRLAIERHNHAALDRALARHQPDVVSVWHVGAMSLGLLTDLVRRGFPIVYLVGDDWPAYCERLDAWADLFAHGPVRNAVGRIVERATGVPTVVPDLGASGSFCFISDSVRRSAIDVDRWYLPRTAVVYAGIDGTAFPQLTEPPARPWHWRILYTGRFDVRKGIETLLRAFALLPTEATLECNGRGGDEERARLAQLSRDLGITDRVSFTTGGRAELSQRYQSADVFVFPSEWAEPFGLVPLEAMACGTPVVATGAGGSREFLRDGFNCLLFPPGDAESLAACIRRVAGDAELRAHLGRGGLHTARELDVDHSADGMEAWHDAAVRRYRGGLPPDRVLDLPPATVVDRRPPPVPALTAPGPERPGERLLRVDGPRELTVRAGDACVGVVGEVSRLPFVAGAFAAIVCQDAIEQAVDDGPAIDELARVLGDRGRVVLATPNRNDLATLVAKLRDFRHAARKPEQAYFRAPGQRRAYGWSDFERLVGRRFCIRSRRATGWSGGRKAHMASLVTRVGPLRRYGSEIVLEAEPMRAGAS